jgi:hypothetical protein
LAGAGDAFLHPGGLLERSGDRQRDPLADELVSLIERCWGRAVRELMDEMDVPDSHFPHALSLCNALFNSRELLDSYSCLGLDEDAFVERMLGIYCGALSSLAHAPVAAAH